jgi:hypothetical protein
MDAPNTPKGIQYWIHLLEEGVGRIWVRRLVIFLFAVSITGLYHSDGAKNFSAAEAMDQAQLARNISEGRGYTTRAIRPVSTYLQTEIYAQKGLNPNLLYRAPHPDIVNPPVYPAMLAALFKVLPSGIINGVEGSPSRRPPVEVAIGLFNFGLFLFVCWLLYRIGKAYFSDGAGMLAALVFAGTKLNWEFVFSGLPTLWLAAILLLAGAVILKIESRLREAEPPAGGWFVRWSALLGFLVAVAFLTSYAAGALLIPFCVCLWVWGGARRLAIVSTVLVVFLALTGPWMIRNWNRSGLPLGAATLAPLAGTLTFPEDRLERSQSPELAGFHYKEVWIKVSENVEKIMRFEIPEFGGNWFSAFLLVGLMLPLGDARLNRLRWLLLAMLVTLIPTQALIRTHLSTLCPTVNSENLLAWFAPFAFLFAASAFRRALSVFQFPFPLAKTLTQALAIILCSMSLLVSVLPPKMPVMSSPPYYLPAIRQLCGYLPPDSFAMTDMPWALAWYGRVDSVQLTLRTGQEPKEDFFRIHDFQRPFTCMLLTPLTCDVPWRAEMLASPDAVWGRFYMDFVLRRENIPSGYPLKYAFGDGFPFAGYLFLADRPYWRDVK